MLPCISNTLAKSFEGLCPSTSASPFPPAVAKTAAVATAALPPGMVWYGMVWYGMVDVCDGYLAAEASGSSFG